MTFYHFRQQNKARNNVVSIHNDLRYITPNRGRVTSNKIVERRYRPSGPRSPLGDLRERR